MLPGCCLPWVSQLPRDHMIHLRHKWAHVPALFNAIRWSPLIYQRGPTAHGSEASRAWSGCSGPCRCRSLPRLQALSRKRSQGISSHCPDFAHSVSDFCNCSCQLLLLPAAAPQDNSQLPFGRQLTHPPSQFPRQLSSTRGPAFDSCVPSTYGDRPSPCAMKVGISGAKTEFCLPRRGEKGIRSTLVPGSKSVKRWRILTTS